MNTIKKHFIYNSGIYLIILIVILVFYFLIALGNFMGKKECSINASDMNRNYHYDFFGGCRIQLNDGTYINKDMYRNFNN